MAWRTLRAAEAAGRRWWLDACSCAGMGGAAPGPAAAGCLPAAHPPALPRLCAPRHLRRPSSQRWTRWSWCRQAGRRLPAGAQVQRPAARGSSILRPAAPRPSSPPVPAPSARPHADPQHRGDGRVRVPARVRRYRGHDPAVGVVAAPHPQRAEADQGGAPGAGHGAACGPGEGVHRPVQAPREPRGPGGELAGGPGAGEEGRLALPG